MKGRQRQQNYTVTEKKHGKLCLFYLCCLFIYPRMFLTIFAALVLT